MDFTGGMEYSHGMKRILISLLFLLGMSTGISASMLPDPPDIRQPSFSAEKEVADTTYNPGAPAYQDDGSRFALIDLGHVHIDGCFDPFHSLIIIDLRSGDVTYVITSKNAYRAIFRDLQSPLGLETIIYDEVGGSWSDRHRWIEIHRNGKLVAAFGFYPGKGGAFGGKGTYHLNGLINLSFHYFLNRKLW